MTAYAVAAWLVLQGAEVTFEPLGLPEWAMRATIVAALAGLPVVFSLAWLIAIESNRLVLDLPLWRGEGEDAARGPRSADALALAIVASALLAWGWSVSTLLANPDVSRQPVPAMLPDSIAVLAFENLGGREETAYFAAGLAEEILNLLAGLNELEVAARTSSFRFRDAQLDVTEVADLLRVKHVLEGSVRQEGNQIRVRATLVDGSNGYHTWSKTYERTLDDIFGIQEQIARAVVDELKVALSMESVAQLKRRPTDAVGAYVYYLQGLDQLRRSPSAAAMRRAAALFADALAIDADFAAAYAGVCQAKLGLYEVTSTVDDFDAAEQACTRARALQGQVEPEVELAFARLYRQRGWYERALVSVDQVLALDEGNVEALVERGEILAQQDRNEVALASFDQAIARRPADWRGHEARAAQLYRAERYREAAEAYEYVNRLAPDVASGFAGKGAAYWMLGELPRARAAFERSLALATTRQGLTNTGIYYFYSGDYTQAVQMQRRAIELAPDDHALWGRLGDAQRFVPSEHPRVQGTFERAVELAQASLEVNANDWWTLSLLGLYYTRLDQVDTGLPLLERGVEMSGGNAEVLYYQGLVRLAAGDAVGALDALESAVEANESYRILVAQDPDLQVLRDSPRFASLLRPSGT
ncbi:MAG: tetratricopeptide repeat protein [Pseudomonadota bacterium]